jgi:hypothetical protein
MLLKLTAKEKKEESTGLNPQKNIVTLISKNVALKQKNFSPYSVMKYYDSVCEALKLHSGISGS